VPKANGLSLHVPAPGVRPGDTPDFSDVDIPNAGETRRPEINADPKDIPGKDIVFCTEFW